MDKIYISLTSIASREAQLRLTLQSLCEQVLDKPYEVHVFLSHEPYLLDDGWDSLPQWPELDAPPFRELIQFHFVPNTGPYRKLLPILNRMIDAGENPIIVTADDDVIYPPHWIQTLVDEHVLCGSIVAFRGHTIAADEKGIKNYIAWINEPKLAFSIFNIPTGREGVLYRPSLLDKSVLDIESALRLAPTADDLWFKMHSLMAGSPVRLLLDGLNNFPTSTKADCRDTLWRSFNSGGGNDTAIVQLIKYLELRHSFSLPRLLSLPEPDAKLIN